MLKATNSLRLITKSARYTIVPPISSISICPIKEHTKANNTRILPINSILEKYKSPIVNFDSISS